MPTIVQLCNDLEPHSSLCNDVLQCAMADPFSIFAATIGIVDVTSRFVQYVAASTSAATTVHQDLQNLLHEFETLASVARSIRDVCTSELLRPPGLQDTDSDPLHNVKRDLGRILIECKQLVEELVKLVKDVIGDSRDVSIPNDEFEKQAPSLKKIFRDSRLAKKLDGFWVLLRKQRKEGEFSQLRHRLHTTQNALQAILATINL